MIFAASDHFSICEFEAFAFRDQGMASLEPIRVIEPGSIQVECCVNGKRTCADCPHGWAGTGGMCNVRCRHNEVQNLERTACTPCMTHSYAIVDENRCVCEAGYFREGGDCIMCPKGRYRERDDQNDALCTACPENQVTRHPGATKAGSCLCPGGYYNSTQGVISCYDRSTCDPAQIPSTQCAACPSACVLCDADQDGVSVPLIRPGFGVRKIDAGHSLAQLQAAASGVVRRIDVFACPLSGMCLGDVLHSNKSVYTCRRGHDAHNAVCATCVEGWVGGSTSLCVHCEAGSIMWKILLVASAVVVAYFLFRRAPALLSRKIQERIKSQSDNASTEGYVHVLKHDIAETTVFRVYAKIIVGHFVSDLIFQSLRLGFCSAF
eukprot:SAG31_NODE_1528_length_8003_cov_1.749620_6_plen_379_part_00